MTETLSPAPLKGSRRPPPGVLIIGSACLLFAAAMIGTAIVVAAAPDLLRPFGFPNTSGVGRRIGLTLLFAAPGAFIGAAGYDLLRLRELGRRVVFFGLALQAAGRALGLLLEEDKAFHLALFVPSVLGAVYLSHPAVKSLFKPKDHGATGQ